MLVALVSAKGSPGVTTTALCLAATWAGDGAVVVEADPAGGDLGCWCGPFGEAGLVSLATALRPAMTTDQVRAHGVEAVPGVLAVTAPTTEAPAGAALASMGERLGRELARPGGDVLIDLGRWSPRQATAGRLGGAEAVAVVCRPTLDSIEHTRGLVASIRATTGHREVACRCIVVGGDRPYGPDEIAGALGIDVLGVLPWDPRAVIDLMDRGATGRAWARSRLAAEAASISAHLVAAAGELADA